MAKRIPPACTPANCGDAFSRCGSESAYRFDKCRCASCIKTKAESIRRYNEANREKVSRYQKQYREENNEKKTAGQRRHYRENREALLAQHKKYYAENRETYSEKGKQYYRKNREPYIERARQWALANPERVRENGRRSSSVRRARMKQVQVIDFTLEQFEQRMAYYGYSCYLKLPGLCTGAFDEIEHVKPLSKGGAHMLANLRPACEKCNGRKWDHWPFKFAG